MPDYSIIETEKELLDALEDLGAYMRQHPNDPLEVPTCDIETTGGHTQYAANDRFTVQLVDIGISWKEDQAICIPIAHEDGNNIRFNRIVESAENEVLTLLEPYFSMLPWCNHVTRFDKGCLEMPYDVADLPFEKVRAFQNVFLKRRGIRINYQHDTYIEAFLCGRFADLFKSDQGGSDVGLKSLVLRLFGYQMRTFEDVAKFADGYHVERVTAQDAAWYVCDDANWDRKLHRKLYPLTCDMFLKKVEMELAPILEVMEQNGIPFRLQTAEEQVHKLREFVPKARDIIYAQIEKQLGERFEFDLNKNAIWCDLLYNRLKYPCKEKSKKTGKPSVSAKALDSLAKDFDLVHNKLVFAKLLKADDGFLSTLPDYVHPLTGCIHSTFHQGGVPTGRMASSKPNGQNWSDDKLYVIKDGQDKYELNLSVRGCAQCEDDELMIIGDYKQQELWIACERAHQDDMLEKIAAGWDGHIATASLIWHMAPEAVTDEFRKKAKTRNFAMIYMESPQGMAKKLDIEVAEAMEMMDEYFTIFSKIKRNRDETIAFARQNLRVFTHFQRPIYLDALYAHPDKYIREKADRFAYNGTIQGTGADIAKIGGVRTNRKIMSCGFFKRNPVFLQVHDSWCWRLRYSTLFEQQGGLPWFCNMVKGGMEFPVPGFKLPARIDLKVGTSLAKSDQIDYEGQTWAQVLEKLKAKHEKAAKKAAPADTGAPQRIRLVVDGQVNRDQLIQLKSLLTMYPGANVIYVQMGDDVKPLASCPTALTMRDVAKFQMIMPCRMQVESADEQLDVIAKALQ